MIYLLDERQLAWPTDWTAVFGREAPLLLEIGFGGGHFLRDLAQKRPSANVLGVEISLPSVRRAQKKLAQAELQNVRLLQGSAQFVLQALCPPQSIHEVYINFPDPWPKAGHQQRRLLRLPFLHLLATRLAPRGRLDVATDHADYAEAITAALTDSPYFDSRLDTPFVTDDPERLRTKYEKLALDQGRTCRYFKWQRNARPTGAAFPPPKELPMPHAILETPLTPTQVQARYEPMSLSQNDVHVRFMEMFQSQDGDKLLLETYINEAPVAQRLGIQIRRRDSGDVVISLHEVGFPRPTEGAHLAIWRLAQWLAGLHPDGRILRHNLQTAVLA